LALSAEHGRGGIQYLGLGAVARLYFTAERRDELVRVPVDANRQPRQPKPSASPVLDVLRALGMSDDPQRVRDGVTAYRERKKADRDAAVGKVDDLASALWKTRHAADLATSIGSGSRRLRTWPRSTPLTAIARASRPS
jgi:hypothetical protein